MLESGNGTGIFGGKWYDQLVGAEVTICAFASVVNNAHLTVFGKSVQ